MTRIKAGGIAVGLDQGRAFRLLCGTRRAAFDPSGLRRYILVCRKRLEEVYAVPIYEYQCSKCGEVFEAFQKISDNPLARCKFCRGKVERLISQSSFQLKGGGWYLTDYARKSGGGSSETASKSSEKTDTSEKPVKTEKTTTKTTEKAASS